jgi:hypothetical protein
MFEAAFPHGEVHYAGNNIGVALNMEQAEQWMFDIMESDVGYFLEDDMILGPYYLKSLQNMVEATKYDPLVGYCACYGPLLRVPDAPPNSLVPMHMNWAFALKRSKYALMAQYLIDYYNLLRDCDYRDRPQGKIMKLREQWNMPGVYTTQDVMHTLACMLTQSIKINSRAHCAKYIGARGLHIDEAAYKAAGFDDIKIYEEELRDFPPITDELIDQCIALHNKFTGLERRTECLQ